jgi:opacity protein-like surface antigen
MKRALTLSAALVMVMVGVHAAHADEAPDPNRPGADLSVRTGYALPFGKADGDAMAISSSISGAVPIVVEGGYRVNAQFTVGAMFQYGFAQTKNCDSGASCSASSTHLALEGIFRPQIGSAFAPWLGLGTGYEWLSMSASAGGQSVSAGAHGFEFLILQAGGDIQVAPQFNLGPFVMFSLGQYQTETADIYGTSGSADIQNKALHEWLQFGIRGTFSI